MRKFDELASRWWDRNGEFRPLHEINPLRLGWIAERATLSGARVLDVGCGGGILAESMAAAGADVLGIDLSEAPLGVARLHATTRRAPSSSTAPSRSRRSPTRCPARSTS